MSGDALILPPAFAGSRRQGGRVWRGLWLPLGASFAARGAVKEGTGQARSIATIMAGSKAWSGPLTDLQRSKENQGAWNRRLEASAAVQTCIPFQKVVIAFVFFLVFLCLAEERTSDPTTDDQSKEAPRHAGQRRLDCSLFSSFSSIQLPSLIHVPFESSSQGSGGVKVDAQTIELAFLRLPPPTRRMPLSASHVAQGRQVRS